MRKSERQEIIKTGRRRISAKRYGKGGQGSTAGFDQTDLQWKAMADAGKGQAYTSEQEAGRKAMIKAERRAAFKAGLKGRAMGPKGPRGNADGLSFYSREAVNPRMARSIKKNKPGPAISTQLWGAAKAGAKGLVDSQVGLARTEINAAKKLYNTSPADVVRTGEKVNKGARDIVGKVAGAEARAAKRAYNTSVRDAYDATTGAQRKVINGAKNVVKSGVKAYRDPNLETRGWSEKKKRELKRNVRNSQR